MSSSGVFGPPPAGIDLSETQDASVRASVISLMIIATVAVALRVLVRTIKKLGGGLSIDDFSIMLGLLFAHGTATCCLVSKCMEPKMGLLSLMHIRPSVW